MHIKPAIAKAYNDSAELWHRARSASLDNYTDIKDLKQNRPHLFIEKPAMYSLVPDLAGKDVLCLGCGSGEEAEFLLTKKPATLTGVDLSEELIKIAAKNFPSVTFRTMDAEELDFNNDSFDFIYSSLMLDYFESWEKVLRQVRRVLKPKGKFQFSNIHPVKWAAEMTLDEDGKKIGAVMGFSIDAKTGKQHVYGDYLNTNLHQETWMKSIPIYYYTKSLSEMFKEITNAVLLVTAIHEPKAIAETKKYDEEYYEINQKIPNFVIFETTKE